MFSGYLFIWYDLTEWGTMRLHSVSELVGLVAFDGLVPSVPEEVIQELRQRVAQINRSGGLWARYQPGDRVLVRLGYQDVERFAEVVTEPKSPRAHVRVLMEIMGRQVNAEVPWQYIWPAGDGSSYRKRPAGLPPRRTRGRGRWINGFGPRAEARQPNWDNGYSSS